jgi:hypothetical protein
MLVLAKLVLGAVAAMAIVGVTASAASAAISPAGTALTAANTGSVVFTVGSFQVSCTRSTIKATTANPLSSVLSITAGANVTFGQTTGCPVTISGVSVGTATIETHGTWDMTAGTQFAGSATSSITLPNNAISIVVTPSIGADCTTTVNASSLTDSTSTYTNIGNSLVINDNTVVFTSSAFPCPTAASNATLQGQYSVVPNIISVT